MSFISWPRVLMVFGVCWNESQFKKNTPMDLCGRINGLNNTVTVALGRYVSITMPTVNEK